MYGKSNAATMQTDLTKDQYYWTNNNQFCLHTGKDNTYAILEYKTFNKLESRKIRLRRQPFKMKFRRDLLMVRF